MIWNKDNCDRYLHTSSKSINEKTNTNAISQTGGSRKISSAFMYNNESSNKTKRINQLKKQGTFTIQLFTGADDIQH